MGTLMNYFASGLCLYVVMSGMAICGAQAARLTYTAVTPVNTVTMTDSYFTDFESAQTRYTVDLTGSEVGCQLLINDIPVLDNDYPGTISKFLINPWLVDGRNTFKIRSLPVDEATRKHPSFDSDAVRSCKVVISGNDLDKPPAMLAQAEARLVTPFKASTFGSKDGEFNVALPYATPVWAKSAKIGRDPATQKMVLDKYKAFHRLLAQKNLSGVMTVSEQKFRDYAKSLYQPTFADGGKTSFIEQFASRAQLIGIDVQEKNGLKYEYYFGDRLVSIKNDENRSIIQYYDDEEGVTTEYPLFFYFDGQDFVLIL